MRCGATDELNNSRISVANMMYAHGVYTEPFECRAMAFETNTNYIPAGRMERISWKSQETPSDIWMKIPWQLILIKWPVYPCSSDRKEMNSIPSFEFALETLRRCECLCTYSVSDVWGFLLTIIITCAKINVFALIYFGGQPFRVYSNAKMILAKMVFSHCMSVLLRMYGLYERGEESSRHRVTSMTYFFLLFDQNVMERMSTNSICFSPLTASCVISNFNNSKKIPIDRVNLTP